MKLDKQFNLKHLRMKKSSQKLSKTNLFRCLIKFTNRRKNTNKKNLLNQRAPDQNWNLYDSCIFKSSKCNIRACSASTHTAQDNRESSPLQLCTRIQVNAQNSIYRCKISIKNGQRSTVILRMPSEWTSKKSSNPQEWKESWRNLKNRWMGCWKISSKGTCMS